MHNVICPRGHVGGHDPVVDRKRDRGLGRASRDEELDAVPNRGHQGRAAKEATVGGAEGDGEQAGGRGGGGGGLVGRDDGDGAGLAYDPAGSGGGGLEGVAGMGEGGEMDEGDEKEEEEGAW